MSINKVLTNVLFALVTATLLIVSGCKSTGSKSSNPADALRTKWQCSVNQKSDYEVLYEEDNLYASLHVPKVSQKQGLRLRTDFIVIFNHP